MTPNRPSHGLNRSSASGSISTSSSISHTQSAPNSSATLVPSQNPPEPPVLVSMRWLTSLSSPNLGRAPASTSCVSSVLALSTTTMRHGGVVIASILSSNSAKYPERLNVTIAIAIFGAGPVGTGLVAAGLVGTGLTQPAYLE